MSGETDFLPERPGETDDEKRLREALNRHCGAALRVLDSAIRLRQAPSRVQRERHLARGELSSFALRAMHSFAMAAADEAADG